METAGAKRRGRAATQSDEPHDVPVAKPPAKRTKRLVARASPTARVIEPADSSGALAKPGKALAAAPPRPTAVKDVWSFEEAHCKPKPAATAPKAAEPVCVPDAPLSVFELVRYCRSFGCALACAPSRARALMCTATRRPPL